MSRQSPLASTLASMLLLLLVALAAAAAPAKAAVQMHAGTLLTGSVFKNTIDDGIWLVEHYSPYCHHCREFAPTWIELVNSRKRQAKTINFHFGQVDCSVDGDLCDSNNVKGYPSIFLYENGQYVEQFKKERTLEVLNKWLDARLPDEPTEGASDTDSQEDPIPVPNPGDAKAASDNAETLSPTPEHPKFQEGTATKAANAAKTDADIPKALVQPNVQAQQQAQAEVLKRVIPNAEGKLISADKDELQSLISGNAAGPVFVKYYAPWCGHCKHLAPAWLELAGSAKGVVNIVEFNCDTSANKEMCRNEGIKGYPTLIFYNQGEKKEYRGGRDLPSMMSFATKLAASSGLRDVSATDLAAIASEDDVFFLYLHPASGAQGDTDLVQSGLRTLLGSAPVFRTSSSDLYARYGYPPMQAAVLVFRNHDATAPVHAFNVTARATSTEGNVAGDRKQLEGDLVTWLHENKYPTLGELTGSSFKEYMEDGQFRRDSYIILASISKKALGEARFRSTISDLERVASAWKSAIKFNPKTKPVHFVWVNADTWHKYLSATYRLDTSKAKPQVIIANPLKDQFYTADAKKESLSIDGRQLFEALESLFEGKLKPQISLSFGERISKWLILKLGWIFVAMGNHPVLSVFVGISIFIVFFCVLVYLMDESDGNAPPVHQPKFVNTGQTLYSGYSDSTVKKD